MSGETPLPELMRAYRRDLGLTQAQLAERWGDTVRNIGKIEGGAPTGKAPYIRRLIQVDRG